MLNSSLINGERVDDAMITRAVSELGERLNLTSREVTQLVMSRAADRSSAGSWAQAIVEVARSRTATTPAQAQRLNRSGLSADDLMLSRPQQPRQETPVNPNEYDDRMTYQKGARLFDDGDVLNLTRSAEDNAAEIDLSAASAAVEVARLRTAHQSGAARYFEPTPASPTRITGEERTRTREDQREILRLANDHSQFFGGTREPVTEADDIAARYPKLFRR